MGLLSSLGRLLKKIVKKIIDVVKNLVKKLWPIILLVAAIYFAPVIATYLTSVGGPAWLSSAFAWVGTNVTPLLLTGMKAIWAGAGKVAGAAWTGFKGLELSQQAAIVVGASALIAPEETAAVVSDFAEVAGEIVGTVGSGLIGGFLSSTAGTVVLIGGGLFLLWWLSGRKKDERAR